MTPTTRKTVFILAAILLGSFAYGVLNGYLKSRGPKSPAELRSSFVTQGTAACADAARKADTAKTLSEAQILAHCDCAVADVVSHLSDEALQAAHSKHGSIDPAVTHRV